MNDDTCTDLVGTGRLCGNRYGRVQIDIGSTNLPMMMHYRSDGLEVEATPLAPRGHYQSVVSVNHNRYFYGYGLNDEALSRTRNIEVSLDFLHQGDTVTLEFRDLPGNPTVTTSGYSATNDLNSLIFGPGKRFLRLGNSVYVKMMAAGNTPWNAGDKVNIRW